MEKNRVEEDLIKLENKLQVILQEYEAEAHNQPGSVETQCSALTPELASELDCL